MQTLWIALGALAGLTAVAMAALAAHALHGLDTARLAMVHNATEMQIWHALALLICGLWAPRGGRLANGAGGAFTLGPLTFCGALYTLGLYEVDFGRRCTDRWDVAVARVGTTGSVGNLLQASCLARPARIPSQTVFSLFSFAWLSNMLRTGGDRISILPHLA